jgi:hypothetical protein
MLHQKLTIMKKFIPVLLSILILTGCQLEKQPEEKTIIGSLTPYFFFPESLNGKVKEVKELNYWTVEKDGKISAGEPITIADRDSLIEWTNDFLLQFDESGSVEKIIYLDENDESFGQWEAINEGGKIKSANWIVKDTVRNYLNSVYKEGILHKMKRYRAKEDTLMSIVVFEFNEDGNFSTLQFYNFKNEPTNKYDYSYNPEGLISKYSWSRNDTIRGGMNFTYNQNGIVETQEVYNEVTGTSETYKYEYEFDELGNWINYVASKDNKPEAISTRSYVYY